jgi:menaquinone-dependent protoporphyrinogen IX oxidase
MQIIIYGSLYGSTKRYAEHLSEMTGIEAVAFKDVKDIAKYDRVIYMGALFAGSVLGLRKTASRMSVGQKLTIITVGMVDPANLENIDYISRSIKGKVPAHLYDETQIYHLRGAIDYSHLTLKHRTMLSVVHWKLSKMPEEKLNAEAKTILAIYGKNLDNVDFKSLEKIDL